MHLPDSESGSWDLPACRLIQQPYPTHLMEADASTRRTGLGFV